MRRDETAMVDGEKKLQLISIQRGNFPKMPTFQFQIPSLSLVAVFRGFPDGGRMSMMMGQQTQLQCEHYSWERWFVRKEATVCEKDRGSIIISSIWLWHCVKNTPNKHVKSPRLEKSGSGQESQGEATTSFSWSQQHKISPNSSYPHQHGRPYCLSGPCRKLERRWRHWYVFMFVAGGKIQNACFTEW